MQQRRIAPADSFDPFANDESANFNSEQKPTEKVGLLVSNQTPGVDNNANNQSIAFRGADGGSIDIGAGPDEADESEVNSEDERAMQYGNDASNNLSYTKMCRVRDDLHIREKVLDEQNNLISKPLSVCKTKTGSHNCTSRQKRSSDLAAYGVGTVLYFQMLKYLAAMFFAMFMLSMPAMLFFFYGTDLQDSSFTQIVAAASLGNLGSSQAVCREGTYDLDTPEGLADPKGAVSLSCPFGELYDLFDFGQISVNQNVDCETITKNPLADAEVNYYPPDCHMRRYEENQRALLVTHFEQTCKGRKRCVFEFKEEDLPIDSCTLSTAKSSNWKYLVLASCSATSINMGGEDVKVSKTLIGVIVVFFDLIITFIFWCSLLGLKKMQDAQEREINGDTVVASDYSVVVTQEPYTESLEDLPAVYYAWAENICSKEQIDMLDPVSGISDENQNQVWNVQLGLTNLGYLSYMKRMGVLLVRKKKLDRLKKQLEEKNASNKAKTKVQVKISALQKQARKILKDGNEYKENNPANCRYAYIQFQSMNGKQKFLKAMDINSCRRCMLRCKKQQDTIEHKYLGQRWPKVQSAPDPSLILWPNLGKGKIERCGRATFSYIFAMLLLIFGFLLVVYLMDVKAQSEINTSQCGELEISLSEAFKQYKKFNSLQTDINDCYCLQEFKKVSNAVTDQVVFADGTLPCKKWMEDYSQAQFIGIVVSVSLSAINGLLRFILRNSSKIEGHHTMTNQLQSAFSKMWILQYVNTAIILLIVQNRLAGSGLIQRSLNTTGLNGLFFNGNYYDFTPEWYDVVGITIFTTAITNGISPIFTISQYVVAQILRCLDRSCSRNEKKTKKIIQEEYEAQYTGKQIEYDNRLSVLIAMIWVVMMFSAAIPTLYLAGVLLCFFTYWSDKFLLLKFYKTPPRHGSDLAHRARSIIEWSLIVHLFTGMYMLSNPDIFVGEEEEKPTGFFAVLAEFITVGVRTLTGVDSQRFRQAHVIFYAIGTGFFLAFFIIEKVTGFFSRLMGRACCCCLNRDTSPELFSDSLFGEISAEQRQKVYAETKFMQKRLTERMLGEPESEFTALREYYKQRLLYKIRYMRYNIVSAISLTNVDKNSLRDTKSAFFSLNKPEHEAKTTELFQNRMRGVSSYNVLDSLDFSNAKKIETRLSRYDKRNKRLQQAAAQQQRVNTLAELKSKQAMPGERQTATDVELTAALNRLAPQDHDIM